MHPHPAYPTTAHLADEAAANGQYDFALATNRGVADIIQTALTALARLDLTQESMVPGFDLPDVVTQLRECMPVLDQPAQAALMERAREIVEGLAV